MSSNTSAVVLDLGEALTKVGFAGDAHPTHIYRTAVRAPATGALLSPSASLTPDEWCAALTALLRRVYFERLLVNPRDRRVLVCDHPLWPRAFRVGLVRALFALDAPAVKMAPALALPIYCTANVPAAAAPAISSAAPASSASTSAAIATAATLSTASPLSASAAPSISSGNGLIVDIGSCESRVLPVCDGFALHELLTCGPCGMRAVVDHFVFLAGRASDDSAAASAPASSSSSSSASALPAAAAAETAAADRMRHLLRLAASGSDLGANSDLSLRADSSSSSSRSSSSMPNLSPFAALTAAEAEDAVARFCFVQSRSAPIGTRHIKIRPIV
jgi:hypothetical protein